MICFLLGAPLHAYDVEGPSNCWNQIIVLISMAIMMIVILTMIVARIKMIIVIIVLKIKVHGPACLRIDLEDLSHRDKQRTSITCLWKHCASKTWCANGKTYTTCGRQTTGVHTRPL